MSVAVPFQELKIENGRTVTDFELRALAEVLEVDVVDLFEK